MKKKKKENKLMLAEATMVIMLTEDIRFWVYYEGKPSGLPDKE